MAKLHTHKTKTIFLYIIYLHLSCSRTRNTLEHRISVFLERVPSNARTHVPFTKLSTRTRRTHVRTHEHTSNTCSVEHSSRTHRHKHLEHTLNSQSVPQCVPQRVPKGNATLIGLSNTTPNTIEHKLEHTLWPSGLPVDTLSLECRRSGQCWHAGPLNRLKVFS